MNSVRKHIRQMHPYIPGEQPKERGLVKLNTNENPYPPAPKVLSAIKRAVDGRLRLYPDPRANRLREQLAGIHGVDSENVIIGNGSDELLGLATRAFVDPDKDSVQYFTPSYSLYPALEKSLISPYVNIIKIKAVFFYRAVRFQYEPYAHRWFIIIIRKINKLGHPFNLITIITRFAIDLPTLSN